MTKKIIGYVKEQLKKGYSASAISRSLLKSGYRKGDIDKIFTQVYSPEVRHVIHFSPTTLIAIAGIFTGLASMLFVFLVFFNSSGVPETLLDLNLKSVKTTVNVGDDITFISELDNLGSAKRYDVNLRYELIHSRTSEVVTFKEETRAIETKGSKQLSMEVPSDVSEGNYILRAIATYDGQRAVATLPVKVEEVLFLILIILLYNNSLWKPFLQF